MAVVEKQFGGYREKLNQLLFDDSPASESDSSWSAAVAAHLRRNHSRHMHLRRLSAQATEAWAALRTRDPAAAAVLLAPHDAASAEGKVSGDAATAAAALESFTCSLLRLLWELRLNAPPLRLDGRVAFTSAAYRLAFGSVPSATSSVTVAYPVLVSAEGHILCKGELCYNE